MQVNSVRYYIAVDMSNIIRGHQGAMLFGDTHQGVMLFGDTHQGVHVPF